MIKRENKVSIKVYFDDGASITYSLKPGGPAALDRDVLADQLAQFADTIRRKAPASAAVAVPQQEKGE